MAGRLFRPEALPARQALDVKSGLLARQGIEALARRKLVSRRKRDRSRAIPAGQSRSAVEQRAYRVRASFLPGRGAGVRERLAAIKAEPIDLTSGAVLEKGIVYIVRLQEKLDLLPSLSAVANPKSSTGRLDIFTRLITDGCEAFDRVEAGYKGELWLEISPRSFNPGQARREAQPDPVPRHVLAARSGGTISP